MIRRFLLWLLLDGSYLRILAPWAFRLGIKLMFPDGSAVAAEGMGIHVIEGGNRRWVPNTWTQAKMGIKMDDLVILSREQLLSIPMALEDEL